jgi:hypothetical protein
MTTTEWLVVILRAVVPRTAEEFVAFILPQLLLMLVIFALAWWTGRGKMPPPMSFRKALWIFAKHRDEGPRLKAYVERRDRLSSQ